jgi:plastocyanin
MKNLLLPFVAVAALVVGAAPATSQSTATRTVQIKRSAFQPATLTIKTGDVVRWVNSDTQNHQVVSNNGTFVSPILSPGKVYRHQFNAAGTYRYRDGLNPTVRGTIKVTGPPPAVTAGINKPIVTYGESIVLSGTVSSGEANETVTLWSQPFGQASFSQVTQVLTTTGGAWSYVLPTAPKILTQYQARWQGRTSVAVQVSVRPRITFAYRTGTFRLRVFAATSHAGRYVTIQRVSRFGQWVVVKKVKLGSKSGRIFKMTVPKGTSRYRVAMSVNQAGAGYLAGFSPTIKVRRR